MAGYMTKLQGYVYEGEFTNGTGNPVPNGILVALGKNAAGEPAMVLPTADAETKLLCKEATEIYDGVPAYRFVVNKLAGNYYLVENGFEFLDMVSYDLTTYTTAPDKYLRAHPLLVGEEFITTLVTGAPVVGNEYGIQADGSVG